VDDQEALIDLDRHHFEHHAVRIRAEEDKSIVPESRILGRRLADDRLGSLRDMTAALAADAVLCR
jgi:hypothetical protein